MSNIIKVDLSDKYRTLLTDVLPYELPLWYTNYTMYKALKENLDIYVTISNIEKKQDCFINATLIPLDYDVYRGELKSPRKLSIIHPFSQLEVCNFYEKNSYLIEYYCSKSEKSLRFPFGMATCFFGKLDKTNKQAINDGIEMFENDQKTASSFFRYLKYPFLYRFFESYEYQKLEKRFNHMMLVDIAKCFPNIYTHTIGWATKNKRLAKNKSYGSFEGDFDSLMQNTNYRETHGIVVGPEFSRIFAEIILQQIDIDIIVILERVYKYKEGKDFDFRRYVDDYFVFYRSEEVGKNVHKVIGECLIKYKLHLNEAKTEYKCRPFTTKISIAKENIKMLIDSLYSNRNDKNGEITDLVYPDRQANQIISKIKMILAKNDVQYSSISNYLIKSIQNQSIFTLNEINKYENIKRHCLNWILVDLDVLFFFHSMDIRIRTTDKIAKQVEFVLRSISKWQDEQSKDIIYKKVFDLVKQAIDIFLITNGDIFGLETLNLLLLLTLLPEKYKLDNKILNNYYKKIEKTSSEDDFYFRWITFLLYIKNDKNYTKFKNELICSAIKYFSNNKDLFKSTHFFIFFFDFVACPYVDKEKRVEIIDLVKKSSNASYCDKKKNHILTHNFIVPWNEKNYLQNSLNKREFIFSYE